MLPFVWGKRDCALFAAAGVEALTGTHPCPWLVGKYHDREGAEAILAEHGGLEALATQLLGPPLSGAAFARRGDVVLFEEEGERRLGLCVGRQVACKHEAGLAMRSMRRASIVWPVGVRDPAAPAPGVS